MAPIFKAGLLILVVIVLAIVVVVLKNRPREAYLPVDSLLTPAELKFYEVLKEAAGDYVLFAKVRVADVLNVDSKKAKGKYLKFFNRIARKHIDFLLCEEETLRPVLAIELDDRSHEKSERIERDIFLDKAFKMAGLPLIRIKVSGRYNRTEIERLIKDATG